MSDQNVRQFNVGADDDGIRLDRWFKRRFPALGHGRLEKLLRTGQIRVDGCRAKAAMRTAKQGGSLLPPKHILNSPTKLMKSEGYGASYEYDHDAPDAFSGQDYFPEALGRQTFYDPPDRGFEREIRKRLDYWAKLRRERDKQG
jgi:hypothetical protein